MMKITLTTPISLGITLLMVTGCTVYLPPGEEPVPAADPIVIPQKNTSTPPPVKPASKVTIKKSITAPANTEQQKNRPEPRREEQVYYVVKPGDTVFEVMKKTGVHWKEIVRLNTLKAPNYLIHPGQSLRIR